MLQYAGTCVDEPRGYMTLGTGPLNRFYQAQDRWFFLGASAMGRQLADVEGLQTAGLGEELEKALEDQFSRSQRRSGSNACATRASRPRCAYRWPS